jgi:hypothetical protein
LKRSIAPALSGGGGFDALVAIPHNDYAAQKTAADGGRMTSLASLRRFWAMAASVNSSCAP